jgi:alkylation response protein AidB-like acyl-CoA dehydrogenase
MELKFTEEEEAFRQEICDFVAENLDNEVRTHLRNGFFPTKEMIVDWQRKLNVRGWATPRWPVEWGGTDWSASKVYIFQNQTEALFAPQPLNFNVSMIGPVILQFGSEAQKKRFLPGIANLDDWWCQGFSEPGAGSDLAALQTKCTWDGEQWVVNGQKTWTTYAQHADWMFTLVRTSNKGKKQEGISFLLIDMKSPGISLRPIQTMDGACEINEVFLQEVKVPAENMIGEVNKGWTYAKFLLGHERLGAAHVGLMEARLQQIKEISKTRMVRGKALWDHPRFRDRFIEAQIEVKAMEMTALRVLSAIQSGHSSDEPDPATSVIKLKGAQTQQLMTEMFMELAGDQVIPRVHGAECKNARIGPAWVERSAPNYFNFRKASIYGGSDQVQKTIISKAILGF